MTNPYAKYGKPKAVSDNPYAKYDKPKTPEKKSFADPMNSFMTPGAEEEQVVSVEMPDGSIQEFPDVISANRAKAELLKSPSRRVKESLGLRERSFKPNMVESAMRQFETGMGLGLTDEARGIAGGITGAVTGEGFVGGYEKARDAERARQDQDMDVNPITSTVANLAGSLGSTAVKGVNGVIDSSLTGMMKQGTLIGATEGAGYSDATDPGSLALDTLKGGGLGAGFGAVAKGAERGVKAVVNKYRNAKTGFKAVTPEEILKAEQQMVDINTPKNMVPESDAITAVPRDNLAENNLYAAEQRMKDFQEAGVTPTQGEITQDISTLIKQKERGVVEGKVAQQQRNATLQQRQQLEKGVERTQGNPFAAQNAYENAIAKNKSLDDFAVDLYEQANNAVSGEKVVRFNDTSKFFKRTVGETELGGGVLQALGTRMKSIGVLDKTLKPVGRMSPKQANELTNYANSLYEAANPQGRKLIKQFKDSIDEDVFMSAGQDFYSTARKAMGDRQRQLDPSKRDKFDNSKVSLVRDIVENKLSGQDFERAIFSSGSKYKNDDILDLKDYIDDDQWKNIEASAIQRISDKLFQDGSPTSKKFRSAIDSFGDQRLKTILGKEYIDLLKQAGRIIAYKEDAVGRTAQTGLGGTEIERAKRLSEEMSKVKGTAIIAGVVENRLTSFTNWFKDKKLLNMVDQMKKTVKKIEEDRITPNSNLKAAPITAATSASVTETQQDDNTPTLTTTVSQRTAAESKTVSEQAEETKKYLERHEGYSNKVYRDSVRTAEAPEGYITAGIGHKLTPAEIKKYPVGSTIPKEQIDKWFREDARTATLASNNQAREIGISNAEFKKVLTSVNFQMGTSWIKKFPRAWQHLKNGDYDRAIQEIKYTSEGSGELSTWNQQTPKRVADFVEAIEKLDNV